MNEKQYTKEQVENKKRIFEKCFFFRAEKMLKEKKEKQFIFIYILVNIVNNIMRIKRKVWTNRLANQKLITIPKDSDVEEGDWVWIEKVEQ